MMQIKELVQDFPQAFMRLDILTIHRYSLSGPAKQISKWRGYETLASIVGQHDLSRRKNFEFYTL